LSIHEILYQYWGYKNFRPLQEEIIQSVITKKNTLALLPTGGGKSLCYQIPALYLEGICLVVSPLIALIKDQVDVLNQKNIPALMIYSGMSFKQVDNILKLAVAGNHKFLYVSPERLTTKLFLEYLPAININMIAVDEAHCISQWGYDFRPPYLQIADIKKSISNTVPILALTASATEVVQKDICEKLAFGLDYKFFQNSFLRPNLSYTVRKQETKIPQIISILEKIKGAGIVYANSRKRTQEISSLLNNYNLNTDYYHAGLSNEIRNTKQQQWIESENGIMVSTNAFGMGIDKSNVRTVIHIDVPNCLENYYQEAGRAGRDNNKGYAVLLYNDSDIERLQQSIDIKYPPINNLKQFYIDICNYLQIPEQANIEIDYKFDIAEFAKRFNYSPQTILFHFQLLAQLNVLQYNPVHFLPSTVQFICNNKTLSNIYEQHPILSETAKALLRTYGGILDNTTFINEKNIAFILKKNVAMIYSDLERLHHMGIIEYKPIKDEPILNLLQPRMHFDHIYLNEKLYTERKNVYTKNVNDFISFILNNKDCRSILISKYFGVDENKECGICDNCITKKKSSQNYLNETIKIILEKLSIQKSINIKDVGFNKNQDKWNEAIQFLINEGKIEQNGNLLILKTKENNNE
jgi:ATP-dependent DNA helicase RecQ